MLEELAALGEEDGGVEAAACELAPSTAPDRTAAARSSAWSTVAVDHPEELGDLSRHRGRDLAAAAGPLQHPPEVPRLKARRRPERDHAAIGEPDPERSTLAQHLDDREAEER